MGAAPPIEAPHAPLRAITALEPAMGEPAKKMTMRDASMRLSVDQKRIRRSIARAIDSMRFLARLDPLEQIQVADGDPRRVVEYADEALRQLSDELGSAFMPVVTRHCADLARDFEVISQFAHGHLRLVRAVAVLTLGDEDLVAGIDPVTFERATRYLAEREPLVACLEQMSPEDRRRLDEEVEAGQEHGGDVAKERASLVG